MMELLSRPWPWYVAGPLIGLVVPFLYWYGGRKFGLSTNFQHLCAAVLPSRLDYFRYDWKSGLWQLAMAAGLVVGGVIGAMLLTSPDPAIAISAATVADLQAMGITDFEGIAPRQFFSWEALTSFPGILLVLVGGFLVGFGARYAGSCTSGHGISGLANLQVPSLVAVLGFFAGGLLVTHVLYPLIF